MKNINVILRVKFLVVAGIFSSFVWADVNDYAASPPLLSDTTTPMIMLAMPNDHQLFYKAYTDWDDLDGNGVVETTYTHSIDYAGYFDSYKCYSYSSTNNRFVPQSITSDKYCNAGTASGQWSGNFLNWATMTRMDEVRKVLYGGFRSTDSSTVTVLERAFLPNDAHSFAKYYNGSDLYQLTSITSSTQNELNADTSTSGITICNTTDADRGDGQPRNSASVDDPPLMKIVKGNYSLWAAGERFQCTYNNDGRLAGAMGENGNTPSSTLRAYGDSPNSSEQILKLIVRVEVCVSGLLGKEDCKQYPSSNYKPVGLLQEFGDDDSVHYGLMSGSYEKNKSGGILRKNIGSITDEINVDTDGTFKSVNGIIKNLNTFRIVGYEYWYRNSSNSWNNDRNGTYKEYDDCTWGLNTFSDGECKNWGNPFAEILLECYRYYAGKSATTAFSTSDTAVLSGLSAPGWVAPVTTANACAKLNVIAFNASTISYDGDALSGFSDILDSTDTSAAATAAAATKKVGDGEGITGNSYFVGESGGSGNQLCTAKTVNDLGSVEGTCSDAPRLDGTYNAAGIAHHAHVNDIAPSISGDQLVTTYGVTLSPALPEIKISVPGSTKKVSILPGCHNDSVDGNCGLVDFKILQQYTLNVAGTTATGSFYVNWEDSEQGGDYDQDMAGILSYEITATKIEVTTEIVSQSTPNKIGFGYIMGGTTNDGFHAQSGINDYDEFDCSECESDDAPASKEFDIGTSTASLLEQPLFYAAKWGGFVSDGTVDSTLNEPIPDKISEWDVIINSTGAYGSDGIPDNYFYAVNPAELKDQLEAVVRDILARTSSGTAASVVTSTGAGEGAVFQALYNPRYDTDSTSGNQSITWVGTLHGLFLDRYGELREDVVPAGESAGQLTNADPIVTIYYDQSIGKTMVQRYNVGTDGKRSTALGSPFEIDDINPIWSARDQLAALTNFTTNRTSYDSIATGGRYIFTGIDDDANGWVEQDEVVAFDSTTFDKSGGTDNFRLLGFEDADADADVANLVNYIRGDESVSGFRNRTIEYDGNSANGEEPWLLGDIVNSSPTVLTRPSQNYDIGFNDLTYRNYRNAMSKRRQVVFVGANDGMLHAFNAGFYDPSTSSYKTVLTGGTETAHPLGAELWAYIPYNVLPHLRYLADPSYPHVYYVDGEPQLFDVNGIWSSGSAITHPDGWGTILVVGLRFGGGQINVDPDSDPDGDPGDDLTMMSSYLILDVTDPESPPELIGEINHADLGYTLSRPTLVKHRSANSLTGSFESPDSNNWYLVFGSGPAGSNATARKDALDHAVSDKTAKVFIYDLKNRNLLTVDTTVTNSFIGGFTAADWNNDYVDDAVYFGVVGGSEATPTGRLMRAKLNWNSSDALPSSGTLSISNVLDVTNQPFSAAPTTARDRAGNFWVYSGTGRFYTVADNLSTSQQSYYGIKDPVAIAGGNTQISHNSALVETTGIQVFANGAVLKNSSTPIELNTGQVVDSFKDILDAVADESGWFFDFSTSHPLERNVTKAALSEESLVFTTYQPTGKACDPDGTGRLYAPHFQAGVPGPYAPLETDSGVTHASSPLVNASTTLGIGNPSAPTIYRDSEGNNRAIVQTSTGEIVNRDIGGAAAEGHRQSWREIPITW